jgi:hypothetical protein
LRRNVLKASQAVSVPLHFRVARGKTGPFTPRLFAGLDSP